MKDKSLDLVELNTELGNKRRQELAHYLIMARTRRRVLRLVSGDVPEVRSMKAARLWEHRKRNKRALDRGPMLVIVGLMFALMYVGVLWLAKPIPAHRPVITPKHVPVKAPEPEPTLEADEPLDYQGLELS